MATPCTNQRQPRQRAQINRPPHRRGQSRIALQRPHTRARRAIRRHPRRRSRRIRSASRKLPHRIPPGLPLRDLPPRYHASRRLAQATPPTHGSPALSRAPRRRARPRRSPPQRQPRRQAPRANSATDRRPRTHLVPRQHRAPPSPQGNRVPAAASGGETPIADCYSVYRRIPRNAYYGDGSEIEAADLDAVRDAFHHHEIVFSWEKGDMLLLDNMRMSHGRRPFCGPRKVVVAMADPFPVE